MKITKLLLTAPLLLAVSSCQEEKNGCPNVIIILADDLGYGDLSCYGQENFSTPNIDKLASEGMVFLNHYSGSTVCAPSRNCLLTGQHTGHATVRGNGFHNERIPLKNEDITLAEILKKKNYTTAIFGKWGLGENGSTGTPNKQGFDEWYGYLNQKNAHNYYPEYLWRNEYKEILDGNLEGKRSIYSHHLFTNEAINFIKGHKDSPFFLFLPYTIPHAELVSPETELELFRGRYPEISFDGSNEYPSNEFPRATYAAMVYNLDQDVGRLQNLLDSLRLSDNTLIIFTSDNGPEANGKHGCDPEFFNSTNGLRGVKRDLYEGGIRVPFIACWPGIIKSGSRSELISASWDILPTLAEITGIEIPENIDGISLYPELSGQATQIEHEYLYWEFHMPGNPSLISLRINEFKVHYIEGKGLTEVFNLESDPFEENNIILENEDIVKMADSIIHNGRTISPYWKLNSVQK